MKRSRKVFAWIAGVLLVVVVVLVVVVATFDWNRLKPFIDDKVSQEIGRPFEIRGDLTVAWRREPGQHGLGSLVPWPEFTARDIRIGNPDWARHPDFATLDALRFRLAPLPLLAHRVEIPAVQLVHPVADLERDAQGRATWDFTLPKSEGPSVWQLNLKEIGFDRGQIGLDDAVSKTKLNVAIEPLGRGIPYDRIMAQQARDAREEGARNAGAAARKAMAAADQGQGQGQGVAAVPRGVGAYLFAWQAKGSYKGNAVKGSGKTGGVLALQQADRPFPVQLDAHIGDSHIALVGTLADPMHLGALDLKLWFSGSSMAKLYPIIGVTLPDTPPYATEGHLRAQLPHPGSPGSHFSYEDFRGRVGGSDLSGSLAFDTRGPRPRLSGQVASRVLRFADLGSLIGADSDQQKKQRGDDTVPQPKDKVLPVEPFRTDRWNAMDADVAFRGERIERSAQLPITKLDTHIYLEDGRLRLEPLDFGMAGGTVASTIRLDGAKQPMPGTIKLSARHLQLKQLFPTVKLMQQSRGEINGDADLRSRGNSVAALLGNANGELKLLMNDGQISNTLLEAAGLNVANLVVSELFGDKTVHIRCLATDLVARDGVFDSRLFAFDTDPALINVDGNVNLKTEQMDLNIRPHTKGLRIFSLRSPLYARGTLKNPKVGVQSGPLLLRGGGAVALGAIAPPAALLALVVPSSGEGKGNTCEDVLGRMRGPSSAGKATSPPPSRSGAAGKK
jgi:hypothetical protein